MVRVIYWNRETDEFTPGQSFKGRIYPDRSDISPDGRHMIYFAMGGVAWAIPKTGGTWTAISRVPSLTALAIWPQGDTWAGGGMFTSNESYWLDTHREPLRDESNLKSTFYRPTYSRLERDGWVGKERTSPNRPFSVLDKQIPKGWILRLREKRYPKIQYELEHLERGVVFELPTWEWADWDRNRLVWAEQGCIGTARISRGKLGATKTLADFNS